MVNVYSRKSSCQLSSNIKYNWITAYPIHFDFFNAGQGINFRFQQQDRQTVFAMNLSLATAALSSHLRSPCVSCQYINSNNEFSSKFAIHLHEVYSFVACDFISSLQNVCKWWPISLFQQPFQCSVLALGWLLNICWWLHLFVADFLSHLMSHAWNTSIVLWFWCISS
jgi:hypothetical protein